jgi:hypothetical protein
MDMGTEKRNMSLHLPSSKPQATVASALDAFRRLYLQQALSETIKALDITSLNGELDTFAPAGDLKLLASLGVRGEFVFPVPCVLKANPRLLGYYRLLLGYSQKEFYNKSKLGRFASLEERGKIPEKVANEVHDLFHAFALRASELLGEVVPENISLDFLDDLTLLTLGPQLRGSNNTKIGRFANEAVFKLIESIVSHALKKSSATSLELKNASNRKVIIAFSSDPDISVSEELSASSVRNILAIEIKGGADQSNIWNRLGEAEKSHQSAKVRGFVECWTIYNVAKLDLAKAHEKSPTTNRFYKLSELLVATSDEFGDFRDRLAALFGIKSSKK